MPRYLHVPVDKGDIILNSPKRSEILSKGPPKYCKILGRGAFGVVVKAIFRTKKVAVKIVKILNKMCSQSMCNEANILGWNHQNIVKIIKVESNPNCGIVIMEQYFGYSLENILLSIKLPMAHQIIISLDIVAAIGYCSKRGIVHLDVKPKNILVSLTKIKKTFSYIERTYVCKLCDFGSSFNLSHQGTKPAPNALTGTVRYMSPEALQNQLLTSAADIYSLGITMWQLQHCRSPYYWIKCNETVAYNVVKNDLRPDFKETLADFSYKEEDEEVIENLNENFDFTAEKFLNEKQKKVYVTLKNVDANAGQLQQVLNSSAGADTYLDLECDLSTEAMLNASEIDGLRSVFKSCLNFNSFTQISFANIYKSCWLKDSTLRPSSKRLQQLLKKLF